VGVNGICETAFSGLRPKKLNISCAAIKTDSHLSGFNDDGNLALAVGML
jgi:hypothetical protein